MGFWDGVFLFVKIIVFCFGGPAVLLSLFGILLVWVDGKSSSYVCMKFKQWLELYSLNPKEWRIDDNPCRCIYTNRQYKNIYVRFSLLGTARYLVWKSRAEKRKEQARSNEKLRLLLCAAQTDIDKLRAQSERELAEAKARTEQVRERLGREEK